jgi:hypothetical protein
VMDHKGGNFGRVYFFSNLSWGLHHSRIELLGYGYEARFVYRQWVRAKRFQRQTT